MKISKQAAKAFTFLVVLLIAREVLAKEACVNNFQKCTIRYELQFDFGYAFERKCNFGEGNCVCLQETPLVYYSHPPYVYYNEKTNKTHGLLTGLLDEAIKLCCFGCNRIKYKPPLSRLGDMFSSQETNLSFTAIFPILATKSIKEYFAGPFISMITTPGVAYVANLDELSESLKHMSDAISKTWQLLVLSILTSLNAGFIVWILDTRTNKTDFPRAFPQGAIEGGWWAFVSMTTVGYGDKCPRSIISRSFAVIWILFGIALSGMFTASLTSALTASFSSATIDLGNKKVGVLNTTRYEQNIALRESAIPVQFSNIKDMKAALKGEKVNGLLIDKNVLGYNWEYLKTGMQLSINTNIKNSDTTYGMMFNTNFASNDTTVLNKKWATFLSTFFEYNKDNENIMLSAVTGNLDKKISKEPFIKPASTTGFSHSTYMLFFKFLSIITAVLIALGIIYEVIRRSLLKNKAFSCSSHGLKVSDINKPTKQPTDVEMVDLERKADTLIRDLDIILTEMKAVKRKNSKIDQRM